MYFKMVIECIDASGPNSVSRIKNGIFKRNTNSASVATVIRESSKPTAKLSLFYLF